MGRGVYTTGILLAILLGSAGCSIVPSSGPQDFVVKNDKTASGPQYGLVKLNPTAIEILKEYGPGAIAATFPDRSRQQWIKFGIGDVVSVTIFEAAAGGLFIPAEAGVRPGNFVTLPNQNVDIDGNISVPYAGAIKAVGHTPPEIQAEIVKAIGNRAIEPQAIVALVTQNTSLISVLGEVNNPSRLVANAAGERILDVISRAGGIKDQGYESWVTLERKGKRATVPFGALVYEPANNVWVHPEDSIYVYREPQVFLAFGASGQQGQFPFNMWKISMTQAMAMAGGLLDAQAEPAGVYVYRREPRELAERLGVDCSKYVGPTVPVVYNVDFRDPAGFFLATKFEMRDKDLLFAANAATADTAKLFQLINLVITPAENAAFTASTAQQIVKISGQ